MGMDSSLQLLEVYDGLTDRVVEITLHSGEVLHGVIVGFVKGRSRFDESYVIRWHIADECDLHSLGRGVVGNFIGRMVDQEEIQSVWFRGGDKRVDIHR